MQRVFIYIAPWRRRRTDLCHCKCEAGFVICSHSQRLGESEEKPRTKNKGTRSWRQQGKYCT